MDWINGQVLQGITVEKDECPRSGGRPYYPMAPTGIGCLHTTEGSSVSGALTMLKSNFDAPHFVVGQGRIVQCRPIGVQAAALHAPQNQFCDVQIECIGFSKTEPWLFFEPTLTPLVALMAWITANLTIPLQRPSDQWKDDCSDMPMPWAANNKRRQEAIFPNAKGWYGHVEVIGQAPSNHWDPGCLKYAELFAQVNALLEPPSSESDSMKD